MDLDQRLNSARRRLQENYQEHENGLILLLETIAIVCHMCRYYIAYTDWFSFIWCLFAF